MRGPEGCAWDSQQTYETLARYSVEEAFEVTAALFSQDGTKVVVELGDLLFQVLLLAAIGTEKDDFTL